MYTLKQGPKHLNQKTAFRTAVERGRQDSLTRQDEVVRDKFWIDVAAGSLGERTATSVPTENRADRDYSDFKRIVPSSGLLEPGRDSYKGHKQDKINCALIPYIASYGDIVGGTVTDLSGQGKLVSKPQIWRTCARSVL